MTDKEILVDMFKRNKINFKEDSEGDLVIGDNTVESESCFAFDDYGSLKEVCAY